jgi:DNA-binding transcriptional ArsR family regulator
MTQQRSSVPQWLLVRAADQLRVLGHVVRLRMIEQLSERARSPQELADDLGVSQQNVSKHLQVLHSVGLVSRRREGARVLYALADDGVVDMVDRLVRRISVQLVELSRVAGDHVSAHDPGDSDRDEPERAVRLGR